MNPDTALLFSINDLARATGWLHPVVLGYASYGVVVFAGLLLAGWWTARQRGELTAITAAVWAPVGMLLALGINQPIVAIVGEPRPYTLHPDILVLAQHSLDPSFPSDHAVMAGSVTAGVFLLSRRLGVLSTVAAVVMAFARVYIGAHYPQDVLAGLLLGAAVSIIGYLLAHRLLARLITALQTTAARPLLTKAPAVGEQRPVNQRMAS
jgi:membrane-associated phospholipid phosphatase